MKKNVLLAAFIAVFSLLMLACGNGKKKTEVPNEPTAEQQESVSQETEPQPSESTVSSETQSDATK